MRQERGTENRSKIELEETKLQDEFKATLGMLVDYFTSKHGNGHSA